MTIKTQRLLEQYAELVDLEPDLDKGIIPNVKVLGLVSRNGYRYTEEALQRDVSKIEGVPFYWNHAREPSDRKAEDYHGNFRDARYVPGDGWRANLHYIKEHARTPQLLAIVQQSRIKTTPAPFNRIPALSPDMVTGLFKSDKRGKFIDHIEAVKSVDIVAFTGTTNTLQESHAMPTTWKQLTESLTDAARPGLLRIVESLGVAEEATEKPADDSADAALLQGAERLCATGKKEDEAKAAKIMESLIGVDPDDDDDDAADEDKNDEKLQKAERKAQVLQECLDADYRPSKDVLDALQSIPNPKSRLALIQESLKGKGRLPRGPRSQSQMPAAKGKSAKEEDADMDARLLTNDD